MDPAGVTPAPSGAGQPPAPGLPGASASRGCRSPKLGRGPKRRLQAEGGGRGGVSVDSDARGVAAAPPPTPRTAGPGAGPYREKRERRRCVENLRLVHRRRIAEPAPTKSRSKGFLNPPSLAWALRTPAHWGRSLPFHLVVASCEVTATVTLSQMPPGPSLRTVVTSGRGDFLDFVPEF